jgi:flagellar basal body rod protein FlgG
MVIDVSKILVQLNGQPLMDNDGQGNTVPATVKNALVNAVLSPEQNEKGTQKVQKYELAKKLFSAEKDVEVTAEEVVLMKRRVEELYSPLVVGQLAEMLK